MPSHRKTEELEIKEIDKIIDQNLTDKSQAEKLKHRLHSAFDRQAPAKTETDNFDENDDPWDNVPV